MTIRADHIYIYQVDHVWNTWISYNIIYVNKINDKWTKLLPSPVQEGEIYFCHLRILINRPNWRTHKFLVSSSIRVSKLLDYIHAMKVTRKINLLWVSYLLKIISLNVVVHLVKSNDFHLPFFSKPKDSSHVTQFLWILFILLHVMCLENNFYFYSLNFRASLFHVQTNLIQPKANIYKERPSNDLFLNENWIWNMGNEYLLSP